MNKEIWKDINGYEGLYQISNLGRVKSLNKLKGKNTKTKEIIMNPSINKKGYKCIVLCKNSKQKHFRVHRLVAQSFIPNSENKKIVNHIDCNKINNHESNLEWVTHKENEIHAKANGLKPHGESHGRAKLTKQDIYKIKQLIKNNFKLKSIAFLFEISITHVSRIKNNKSWRCV